MRVGVISVQGDVSEHIASLELAFKDLGITGSIVPVKTRNALQSLDSIVLPGGESTAISKLLHKNGLFNAIRKRGEEGMPIMGTCAGCVLLAKELAADEHKTKPDLLALMDMEVNRNAFGRQKESFETDIDIDGLDNLFHAVFIRGPLIIKTWGNCKMLASVKEGVVFARQGCFFAMAFHPELTMDFRVHKLFLESI